MTDDHTEPDDVDELDEVPPGPFVKIYGSIVESSVWRECTDTRIVWITILAIADAEGFVRASVGTLADKAKVSLEACKLALATLEAPDDDDRSGIDDGRRLRRLRGGWHVQNFRSYRDMRTPKQIQTAQRVKRFRDKLKAKEVAPSNANGVSSVTVTPEGEGEGEVERTDAVVVVREASKVVHISTLSDVENSDTSPKGDGADDVTGGLSVQERSIALTAALNQGLHDNPAVGDSANPALPFSGSAIGAVETLAAQGITLEWARQQVYAIGKTFKPGKPGESISSLAYCVPRLERPWAQHLAKSHVAASPRPQEAANDVGGTGTAPPSTNGKSGRRAPRDLKGDGLIVFGKLVAGVVEDLPVPNSTHRVKAIRAEVLAELTDAGRAALASLPGGARAITHPRDERTGAEAHRWAFAAAYAAAASSEGEP